MISPKHALLAGGVFYGCAVALMLTNYDKRSAFRKIYREADKNYDKVKVLHPPTQPAM